MKAELLILGVLHRGNFHPYEIRRRLKNAMVECYTDVDVGTLYYAIRQLEKTGLIMAVRQEPVARTLYAPMLFLQFSNLPLIADLLQTRISRETRAIREIAEIRKQLGSTPATGALHLLKHLELQHRLDRKWLRGVLGDVEGGHVRDVEDPKRLTRGWLRSKTQPRQRSRGSGGAKD